MTRGRKTARSKPSNPAAAAAALPVPERAELQRQGAKAAARGDKSTCNPMDERPNLPAATGESTGTWRERQEAWQEGHDAQSTAQDTSGSPRGSQDKVDGRD